MPPHEHSLQVQAELYHGAKRDLLGPATVPVTGETSRHLSINALPVPARKGQRPSKKPKTSEKTLKTFFFLYH